MIIMVIHGTLGQGKNYFIKTLEEYLKSIKPYFCSKYYSCECLELRLDKNNDWFYGCELDRCYLVDYKTTLENKEFRRMYLK